MVITHRRRKDLARNRVLVVESNPDIFGAIVRCLSEEGYVVRAVTCGRDAVVVGREWSSSLILLALSLPDTDGLCVCNQLRASGCTEKTPIIFLTRKSEPMVNPGRVELRRTDDYIVVEPLDIEELKLRVKGAIERLLSQG